MRLHFRVLLLIVALTSVMLLIAMPDVGVQAHPAAKEITITITEAQFNRFLPSVKPRGLKSISADIIDGGIIVKLITGQADIAEYHEHYGVLIRDGKIVTEFGVLDILGIGVFGYADIKNIYPELIPTLDRNAKIMDGFVQRQIRAKVGTRYTPQSVTTGNDQVVIVVTK
jgi:hypothetical protein